MRVAVVGAGISGLGAAHLLSRAHDVEVFESESAPAVTRARSAAPRARARHRLPRAQRAELSAADPPLRRARRGHAGVRDVVLGDVPVRPRVLGPPAVRAARPRRRPELPPSALGDRPLAADRAALARRARLRALDARALSRRAAVLAARSGATSSSRSPPRCGRRRPAARSSTRPRRRSASSTTTGCSGSAASAGGR